MNRLVLFLLLAPGALAAQGPTEAARKEARVHRIPGGVSAPDVDGRLEDAAWASIPFIADFTAKEPVEGAEPRAPTRVAFAYDDDALYIGARMTGERPRDVPVSITRRDNWAVSEILIIAFDTYLDRRTAFGFGITSAGTRADFYQPDDNENSRDMGYDPVWEAKVSVDSLGWTAEARIPFSQLRFPDRDEQSWGININRYIPSRNEDLFWVMVPKNETGWSSRFGNLTGLGGIRPSRRLEVVPYGTTNATLTGARNPANPFDDGRNLGVRAGADLKMGLGPSLTLDATVNPDFGQVEADPAEVNLSAFPTFFSERRPFFSEGSDLLQMAGFFYSRRIGAPPHGGASGSFVSRPQNSTILGATKVTGRLSPSVSFAAMAAVTDQEHAETFDIASGARARVKVEPLTAYGATRLVRRFRGAAQAGAMLTGVHRETLGNPLQGILTRDAISGGTNGQARFASGKYEARWMAGASWVRGDTAVIRRIQEASSHYLQRPDASEGGYDPLRTSLVGWTASWQLQKIGGRHWLWNYFGEAESPTFEINDLGRLTAANDFDQNGNIRYRENRPRGTYYSYETSLSARLGYNYGGVRQTTGFTLSPSITWKNYLTTSLDLSLDLPAISDALTRGGPLMGTARVLRISGGFSTNSRKPTSWNARGEVRDDDLGGWAYSFGGGLTIRPSGQWTFSASPGYSRVVDPRQYLSTRRGGRVATYGQRYIFSIVDRSQLSAQFRLSYLLKPDLSLDLYAEPFAASGRYSGFGELVASRSRDLRVYGTSGTTVARGADGSVQVTDGGSFTLPNPDFNVLSFRSNVVLRWEWRPGSTLYLVWQQNRSGNTPYGDLVGPARLWDAVTATGDNFLALKIAYWLPVL